MKSKKKDKIIMEKNEREMKGKWNYNETSDTNDKHDNGKLFNECEDTR